MAPSTLLRFFAEPGQARAAMRALQGKGHRRSAAAHRTANGTIQVWDPFPWRRASGAALAAEPLGSLAPVGAAGLAAPIRVAGMGLSAAFLCFAAGCLGPLFF